MDIQPSNFVLENGDYLSDEKLIWDAVTKGEEEFKIRFQRNNFLTFIYEVIYYRPRKLIFK
jgi:hypothetical protein